MKQNLLSYYSVLQVGCDLLLLKEEFIFKADRVIKFVMYSLLFKDNFLFHCYTCLVMVMCSVITSFSATFYN